MEQYYYDRFTAIPKTSYIEPGWVSQGNDYSPRYSDLAKSYSWNPSTGKFTVNSDFYASGTMIPTGAIGYRLSGTVLYRYSKTDGSSLAEYSSNASASTKDSNSASTNTTYSKGSLVQPNIVAEDGTYPSNGRHSDGFWYVKGAIAVGEVGTIVNLPNTVSPNGRQITRLANGWLVVVNAQSANLIWYVSKDNGTTWSQLCYNNGGFIGRFALVSYGNVVYTVACMLTGSMGVFKFDATTVTNSNQAITSTSLGTINTACTDVDIAVDPKNGHLYIAWVAKTTTFSTSYNVRWAKSTNNADSWSMFFATNKNASTDNWQTASIIVRNSEPVIIASCRYTNGCYLFSFVISGGTVVGNPIMHTNGATYSIGAPSLALDKSDNIHVAYSFASVAANGYQQIMYQKSGDGLTWTSSLITNNGSYHSQQPSISVDATNKVAIVFQSTAFTLPVDPFFDIICFTSSNGGTSWLQGPMIASSTVTSQTHPKLFYDPTYTVSFGETPPTYYVQTDKNIMFKGSFVMNNKPSLTVISPSNNQTLYENDTINISGDAYDADKDQSVTVYFQINSEQRKVLATNLSQTQISLSKQLTFKDGKLFDGETVLTGTLAEGVAHTLKVWAVDNEGAQSATIERTFYVVPNRAPLLAIDAVVPSGIINTDKFKISGTASDQDSNSNIRVNYRINGANPVEVYNGAGGAWEFEVSLAQLVVNENTIIIEGIDNYDAKTSKTVKLKKNEVKTPILQSVARHKISPPKGSARGVLIWVQRDEELDLKVELSMTLVGEQEQYVLLEADQDTIVPVTDGIVEDEYYHETVEPKDNIILKLTTSRPNINIDNKVYLIMGVIE